MTQIFIIAAFSVGAMVIMAAALHFSKYKKREGHCGCGRGDLLNDCDSPSVKVCDKDNRRSCVCDPSDGVRQSPPAKP